jgi:hypothetical protein
MLRLVLLRFGQPHQGWANRAKERRVVRQDVRFSEVEKVFLRGGGLLAQNHGVLCGLPHEMNRWKAPGRREGILFRERVVERGS